MFAKSNVETINSQNCYNFQMTCYEKLVPILTITFVFTPNLKKKAVDKEWWYPCINARFLTLKFIQPFKCWIYMMWTPPFILSFLNVLKHVYVCWYMFLSEDYMRRGSHVYAKKCNKICFISCKKFFLGISIINFVDQA